MADNIRTASLLAHPETDANGTLSSGGIFSFIVEKGSVVVAVSGGSDSMSLLFLANAWSRETGRKIRVVTVDHGLRPQATREADFVAEACDELNIPHAILTWKGEKPTAGISAVARTVRYELIKKFALDKGARIILTGHTQDDQAETVLMRLRRCQTYTRTGSRGHSGMCRRVSLGHGIMLLRPLLDFSRKQLRTCLEAGSRTWMEDSSNCDERYERTQARRVLKNNEEIKNRLLNYASVMAREREAVSRAAAKLLERSCSCKPGYIFELEADGLRLAPRLVVEMTIKAVIAIAGGREHLVSDLQLEKVMILLKKGLSQRITLGNCIVESDPFRIRIFREVRNLSRSIIKSGESLFWDGRVRLVNNGRNSIRVEAMSEKLFMVFREGKEVMKNGNHALLSVDREACFSSPVVITDTGTPVPLYFDISSLPTQVSVCSGARSIENFCPEWDFPLLQWLRGIRLVAE